MRGGKGSPKSPKVAPSGGASYAGWDYEQHAAVRPRVRQDMTPGRVARLRALRGLSNRAPGGRGTSPLAVGGSSPVHSSRAFGLRELSQQAQPWQAPRVKTPLTKPLSARAPDGGAYSAGTAAAASPASKVDLMSRMAGPEVEEIAVARVAPIAASAVAPVAEVAPAAASASALTSAATSSGGGDIKARQAREQASLRERHQRELHAASTNADGAIVEDTPAARKLRRAANDAADVALVAAKAAMKAARYQMRSSSAAVHHASGQTDDAWDLAIVDDESAVPLGLFGVLGPGQFVVHNKKVTFSRRSLCLFGNDTNCKGKCCRESLARGTWCGFGWLRLPFVWLVTWKLFDQVILFFILLNTVFLGWTDFSVVDPITLNPQAHGTTTMKPFVDAYSWRNHVNEVSEPIFLGIFLVEGFMKVMAMGFVIGDGTYLSDGWNCLDFIVIVSGVFALIPGMPNVSALRNVRVLRPLKSLNYVPKIKILVGAILKGIPRLVNVFIILMVALVIYGILGINVLDGASHYRCRLTEFPVYVPPGLMEQFNLEAALIANDDSRTDLALHDAVVKDRANYPFCGAEKGVNASIPLEGGGTTLWGTSPWHTPQDCVWPVDPSDVRGCTTLPRVSISATLGGAMYRCYEGNSDHDQTWCGSSFDKFGNARFVDATHMLAPSWTADRNWGFTTFDTFIDAFNTIFQCFTEEGWTNIMYMYQDSKGRWTMLAMFLSLVMLGAYLLLNLVLAVLGDAFDKEQSEIERMMELENQIDLDIHEAFELLGSVPQISHRGDDGGVELDLKLILALLPPRTLSVDNVAHVMKEFDADGNGTTSVFEYIELTKTYQRIRDVNFLDIVMHYIQDELPPVVEDERSWDDHSHAIRIQKAYKKRLATKRRLGMVVNPCAKIMCLQIPILTIEALVALPVGAFLLAWGLINGNAIGGDCADQTIWLIVAGAIAIAYAIYSLIFTGICSSMLMTCPRTKFGKVCGVVGVVLQTIITFPAWGFFIGWSVYGAIIFMANPYSGVEGWSAGCKAVQSTGWLTWMIAAAFYGGLLLFAIAYNVIVVICVSVATKRDAHIMDPDGSRAAKKAAVLTAELDVIHDMQTHHDTADTVDGAAVEGGADADQSGAAADGDAEASGDEDGVIVGGDSEPPQRKTRSAMKRRHTQMYAKAPVHEDGTAVDLDELANISTRGGENLHGCVTLSYMPCCCCFKYFHMASTGMYGRAAALTAVMDDAGLCWNKPDNYGKDTWLSKAGPWNQACKSTCCQWFCAPWTVPLNMIATSWPFDALVTVLILMNTVTLCLDTYPVVHELSAIVEIVNFCLTFLFTIELLLKFPGLGFRKYCRDPFNCFDMFIVIISVGETALAPPRFFQTTLGIYGGIPLHLIGIDGGDGSGGALSALRTFRVLRLFKLATKIDGLPQLLAKMAKAFANGVYFMIILLLHIFVFALFGMQLFANRLHFDETTHYATKLETITGEAALAKMNSSFVPAPYYTPRHNFDKFLNAFITVWQVLTGENWNNVMYDCRRGTMNVQHFSIPTIKSMGKFFTTGEFAFSMERTEFTADNQGLYTVDFSWAPLYFMVLIVTGAWVVLDFYLAVLLSDFEPDDDDFDDDVQIDEDGDGEITKEELEAFQKKRAKDLARCKCKRKKKKKEATEVEKENPDDIIAAVEKSLEDDALINSAFMFGSSSDEHSAASKLQKAAKVRAMKAKAIEQNAMLSSWVLGTPRPRAMRRGPIRPPMDLSADAVDVLCCCLNGASLCVVEPLDGPQPEVNAELLPMRGYTCFCVGPEPMPTSWKQMKGRDKACVICAWMRRAIACLLQNTPANLPCFLFKEGERVIVTYNSSGRMSEFDPSFESEARIVNIDRPWPTSAEPSVVKWETRQWPSVYDVQRIEWTTVQIEDVMKRMDTVELTVADMRKLLPASMAPGHVEDLVRHFDKDGSGTIDRLELEELLRVSPLSAPVTRGIESFDVKKRSKCTRIWMRLLTLISFDNCILLLIAISSVMLAMETPMDLPDSPRLKTMGFIEIFVNVIFTVEMILKIFAYGTFEQRYSYCRDVWNLLDAFVVCLSWITSILEWAATLIGDAAGSFVFLKALKVLRLLRVLRVLRGIKRLKGLQKIVNGMAFAFGPVLQTTPILLLFMLIFAIIFTSLLKGSLSACDISAFAGEADYDDRMALLQAPVLFGSLSAAQLAWQSVDSNRTNFFTPSQPTTPTGMGVCEWMGGSWEAVVAQSFDNVILAMTSLFQLITTEAWIDVAFAASDSVGMEMQPVEFGQEYVYLPLFALFMFLAALFLFNIPVGVLLGAFDAQTKRQSQAVKADLQTWRAYQNSARRGMLDYTLLTKLKPRSGTFQMRLFQFVTAPWCVVDRMISIPPSDSQMNNWYRQVECCFCWSCRCCSLLKRRLMMIKGDQESAVEMNRISRVASVRASSGIAQNTTAIAAAGLAEASAEDDGEIPSPSSKEYGIDVDGDNVPDAYVVEGANDFGGDARVVVEENWKPVDVKKKKSTGGCTCAHNAIAKLNHELRAAIGCTPVQLKFDLSFDLMIMTFIILNTLTMMITYFGMPNDYTQTLAVANLIFAFIFTLEAILKLSVFGVWGYFQQAGNIFDFVIVVATAFGIFMDIIGADLGSAATVIRTIRILRVIRLFNGFKELKIIVDAIGFSIPYVLNIMILLFLIISIFSVLFMQVSYLFIFVPLSLPFNT